MFKPTLEYILEYMNAKYYGYDCRCNIEEDLIDWMFVVYIPKGCEFTSSKELREIVDDWLKIREEEFATYDQPEFKDIKNLRFYTFFESENNYDWFVFLAICVENNFIIDSVKICGEPCIYDIEPATPRLKVRIK